MACQSVLIASWFPRHEALEIVIVIVIVIVAKKYYIVLVLVLVLYTKS